MEKEGGKLYQYSVSIWGGQDAKLIFYVWANESQLNNAIEILNSKPDNLNNPSAIAKKTDGKLSSLEISAYSKHSANCAAQELQLPLPFDPESLNQATYIYKIRQSGTPDSQLRCNYITLPKSTITSLFNRYNHIRKNQVKLSIGCGVHGITDSPFIEAKFNKDNHNSLELTANSEHELKIGIKRFGLPALD